MRIGRGAMCELVTDIGKATNREHYARLRAVPLAPQWRARMVRSRTKAFRYYSRPAHLILVRSSGGPCEFTGVPPTSC
jgi:hypothetical protein